jgi:predicted Zn-dependent protease
MIPTREEAADILKRTLLLSRATEARAILTATRSARTRFALSGITAAGASDDATVTIVSTAGTRRAGVTTNAADPKEIERAVRESEDLARLSPEDPEYVPEERVKEIPDVLDYFDETAAAGAEARAGAAAQAIGAAGKIHGVASGFVESRESLLAVATTKGFFASHRETLATFRTTIRTADGSGSGWAGRGENRISAIVPGDRARAAAETAARSASPAGLEPGAYAAILEPDAVAALIPFLLLSLDARLALEGRSFLSRPGGGDRIGERLFGGNITLVSDPADTMLSSAPFSADGVRREKRTWIRGGVVQELSCSRSWAARHGGRPSGGLSTALLLGGAASVEEMVASIDRGLLIRRLRYVNMLDPGRLTLTGVTRDGTFLIEKGQVSRPVKDLRFQDSLKSILSSVEALGVPRRVLGEPVMGLPPMKVTSLTITRSAEGG